MPAYTSDARTLLPLARLLQQQIGEALPVLGHRVDLPQAVHQVRTMLMQLKQPNRSYKNFLSPNRGNLKASSIHKFF